MAGPVPVHSVIVIPSALGIGIQPSGTIIRARSAASARTKNTRDEVP